jgi:predicted ATPase
MFTPVGESLHLPRQSTPFIGRAAEVDEIARLLDDPACQLLTLVGPGGIGKTRLALEVARSLSFTDGIYFVDLQLVGTGVVLITAIANALSILLSGPQDPREQILNILSTRETLLLLDNFEQLLDNVDLLADIITSAPDLKLLVTSREALNIQEEWVWQVGGLEVPKLELSSYLSNAPAAPARTSQ